MPIITLTSDWGLKDHYLASVKGALLKKLPDARIIDISHDIPPFDTEQAAFVIRNAYPYFPEGTIHIIGINTEESDKYPHTIIVIDRQYFIGTDNGVFSLIFDKQPDRMLEMTIPQESDFFTFSTRDRFVKAAVHIAMNQPLSDLGEPKNKLNDKILLQPVTDPNTIKGHVIYIDSYQNIITNINEPLFKEIGKGRKFNILFRTYEINKINKSYTDVPPGEIVALFDSNRYLEIAMNQGNAAGLLGLGYKDMIRIEFM